MDRTFQKRVTFVFGIVLAVAMAASLILPLLSQNVVTQNTQPTVVPTATPLPPVQDVSEVTFDEPYLHPSGLFTISLPTDWTVQNTSNNTSEAQVSLQHGPSNSITEVRLLAPEAELTSLEDLDEVFNDGWLSSTWRSYTSWEETTRRVEDGHHIMSFNLELGTQNYISRQEAWYDDNWIYVVRVITPANGADILRHVLQGVGESLEANTQFIGTPLEWNSYFDETTQHIIRYPGAFQVTDAADGAPATIVADATTLRIETQDGSIADEDAARAWVMDWRGNAEVQSVEIVEKDRYNGYVVSYTLPTLDGEPESGLVMLLNGINDQLHIANLQVNGIAEDLLMVSEDTMDSQYRDIIETFTLLPDMQVAANE